jgi:electron transfer flavoprotein beta subunit
MLRSIVCAKLVLDVEGLKVDPKSLTLVTERVERKMSDFDKNALEEALRLREKEGGTVTVVCVGPPAAASLAKEALNMGADEVHLVGGKGADALDARATADTLAAAIAKIGTFDLVLCGEASIDAYAAQVGPRLAEKMGIPQASHVRKLTVSGNLVSAERDLEESIETVEGQTPMLITVTREINEPRIPTITMIIKASKKVPKVIDVAELGGPFPTSVTVLGALAPTTERRKEVIEGTPEEVAEKLAKTLVKEGVVEA